MKNPVFILSLLFTALVPSAISAQQAADPTFDAKVAKPAYTKTRPKVLFDEAHYNFHTTAGRYKPFADLITNDGYIITSNKEKFQKKTLEGYDILIIANALGAEWQNSPGADKPAFTDEECDAVREWVKAGGSLLLIADHAPFGSAAETMAKRFEIDMSKGHTTDPNNFDAETGNMSFLVFSSANKLLGTHAILTGLNDSEKITKILTFTGQSLKGPASAVPLLKLSDTAIDVTRPAANDTTTATAPAQLPNGIQLPPGARIRTSTIEAGSRTSAAGRAQALAMDFGKGRVVALGEAAMISAQVVTGAPAEMMGQKEIKMGMNRAGTDNRQFALNIVHWLSRLK